MLFLPISPERLLSGEGKKNILQQREGGNSALGMVVHAAFYAVGCPTPPPPIRAWKHKLNSPPKENQMFVRKMHDKQRPQTARTQPSDDVTSWNAAQAFERASQQFDEAVQKQRRAPCADEVNDPFAATRKALVQRPPRPKYSYEKSAVTAAALDHGHEEGNITKLDLPVFGRRPASPRPPQFQEAPPTSMVREVDHDAVHANIINSHLYQLATARGGKSVPLSPGRSPKQKTSSSLTLDQLAQPKNSDLYNGPKFEAALQQEKKRVKTFIGSRPNFRFGYLQCKTFDLPCDAEHAQLLKDLAMDEVLYKMKRNTERELATLANVKLRQEEVRHRFHQRLKVSFEKQLALKYPHSVSKAHRVLADEWAEQLKLKALEEGFEINNKMIQEQKLVASLAASQLTQQLIRSVQGDYPGFSNTHREKFDEAEKNFVFGSKRPCNTQFMSKNSRQLMKEKQKKSTLKPEPPRLSCDVADKGNDVALIQALDKWDEKQLKI